MSKQTELNRYIARLQGRLRLAATLRGAAIFAATALAVTLALVVALNHYAFPAYGVFVARMALVAALALAVAIGLASPLLRLTRARAVHAAERAHPELEQRLTTFQQRPQADPFRELLAADTLEHTQTAPPSTLAPNGLLLALGGGGLACLVVLLWSVTAGPGYLGYGASLLWTGPKKNVAPLYALAVTPGDVAVRRNSDQLITAALTNLQPEKVQLFAHFAGAEGWEPVAMQPLPTGGPPSYQFVFTGLPVTVEYYVAAGPLVSPHYKVRVVDLPSVKTMRVTYHYPGWTGMKAVIEEHSGDLRALEGTDAAIEIEMDRPLTNGQLTLDGGKTIQLTPSTGNRYNGSIHMEKDGAYHVAALDAGQPVRLSEDYFIATERVAPPEVAIQRPGGDYRASPIEEVTVGVKAADAFGLRDVHLHYSVNGGPDRDVNLLKSAGAKSVDGAYTLHLENFKLVPGDLVSLYATARDGHAETRTQISFIQADPFEREFSQSQQGGGGGGGGGQNNQTEISKREKELIAATWKQQNDKAATPKDAATAGQFLADAQQKLRDQVMALSARIESRDLSQANEEFTSFEKDMQAAATAMVPSADKLKGMQWSDALPLEQKALQSLLRAEATFRQIQVAFGQQSGGGGGGGSAGRDLASLFDLELDTEKNQYETAQTASPAEQHAKEVEDALAKLDALAKRQEELASQQHNPQQSLQERWQQEMLRREAEQLQRQMEQLAQDKQNQQNGEQNSTVSSTSQSSSQQSSQVSSQSSSSASAQSGQPSSRPQSGSRSDSQSAASSQDQRIEQAASRLHQATEAMKRSTGTQSADAARQAADRLRNARDLFGSAQHQLASGKMDDLSHEADRMVQQQRGQADRIRQLAGSQTNTPLDQAGTAQRRKERDRLATERQQLSNDLSALQKNVRDTARAMAPNQPDAAKTLRDALTEMDQADLDNHVQRTADWLRRGINPNANGTEEGIAQGLEKLDNQLHQAQQAMGKATAAKPGQRGAHPGDQTAALGQVERLRSQLEAMAASVTGNGRQSQNGKENGNSPGQNGSNSRNGRSASQGQASGTPGQPGSDNPQTARNGQGGGRQPGAQPQGQAGSSGGNRNGSPGNPSGDVRTGGGGGNDGTVWGNLNTGNNRYGSPGAQPVAPRDASGNPADSERSFRQGMAQLNQLRQTLQGDPRAAKELQDLTRQMQRLDPSRFPGNPAMVEQMHQEMLSAVDRLELQLQRDSTTEARTGKPQVVPSGYQDSVADYYRRLSKTP